MLPGLSGYCEPSLGLLVFIFKLANSISAIFCLTVAPVGTSFSKTTRANPLKHELQPDSRTRPVNFSSLPVWSLLSLGFVSCHIFSNYWSVSKLMFDWFLTFILRVFASFCRFHISALGYLVALCIEPSVGVFGFLIIQSTSCLLFCTCSVVVKAFYCVVRAIYLFSTWISLGFVWA